MLNKNTKKSPRIEGSHFSCTGKMEMDNFCCVNSSLSLFCFYFVISLRKKNYGVRVLIVEPPPTPHTSQYAFSWTTPPLSEPTYFTDAARGITSLAQKLRPILAEMH